MSIAGLVVLFKMFVLVPWGTYCALDRYTESMWSVYETIASSVALSIVLCSWTSYFFCSVVLGEVSETAIRLSFVPLTFLSVYFIFTWWEDKKRSFTRRFFVQLFDEPALNLVILLGSFYFGLVFFTHSLYKDDKGALWSGGAMWSDMAFHLNVINSFLEGPNGIIQHRPESIIFAGHPLSYPLIADFHTVSLIISGAFEVRWAILLPSFEMAICLLVLLFCFIRRFFLISSPVISVVSSTPTTQRVSSNPWTRFWRGLMAVVVEEEADPEEGERKWKRRIEWIAFWGVGLWLLTGGVGGWTMLLEREWTWDQVVNEDWMQKTAGGRDLFWFSCISHVLLPQRSALFAYPLDLIVFILLATLLAMPHATYKQKTKVYTLCGVVTGLLPLVHAHSFLSMGLLLAVFALLDLRQTFNLNSKTGGSFWLWVRFAVCVLVLSVPQMPNYFDRLMNSGGNKFLSLQPIWRNNPWNKVIEDESLIDLNFFALWFGALGFFVPLGLAAFNLPLSASQRRLHWSFWSLFVIANIVQFQPWDKDNNKVFLVWAMMPCATIPAILLGFVDHPFFLPSLHSFSFSGLSRSEPVEKSVTIRIDFESPEASASRRKQRGDEVVADASIVVVERPPSPKTLKKHRQLPANASPLDRLAHALKTNFPSLRDPQTKKIHVGDVLQKMMILLWRKLKNEKSRNEMIRWGFVSIVFLSLTISGLMISLRETGLWWQFMDKEDQDFALWVNSNLERNATFIVNDSHIHPITNLCGRRTLFNMAGWVSSHGFPDWYQRQNEMRSMLADGWGAMHLWKKYDVDYLVYDWRLTYDYRVDLPFFENNDLTPQVYTSPKYKVFSVRRLHKL